MSLCVRRIAHLHSKHSQQPSHLNQALFILCCYPQQTTTKLPQAYHSRNSLPAPSSLLDIGCSTGISSRWYQRAFPAADITGLDLSPFFLAVAELEERCVSGGGAREGGWWC